ncbi:peptidylprolyl isomerase [Pannus brasiliensis CCIBt3594]|uniref:peptidylprolyl isomerase n=2 Tax=Pannus TaxID=1427526 RepID=A0AAW9QWP3_9CHRO
MPEEIVAFLKEDLRIKEIYRNMVFQKIIDRVARERNVTVTPREIQGHADNFRHEQRLEKADDTFAWLADQMITPEEWEAGIEHQLLRKKLAESLFGREVEKFFAQNKLDYDRVSFYQIIVPYEKLAWEIFYQIEEEEIGFFLAAHLYDIDENRRARCGYEGKLYRWGIHPELATRIFAANPREVICPFHTEQGYHILMVEEFLEAKLTSEIHDEILEKMFQEWLENEFNYTIHNLA